MTSTPTALDAWLSPETTSVVHALDRPTQIVVGVYARFSVGDDNDSTDAQTRRGVAEARRRYPGCKVRRYSDDGYSGETAERPEFARLLGDIAAGVVHVVIAKNQSRIERDPAVWKLFGETTCVPAGIRYLETWTEGNIDVLGLSSAITSLVNKHHNRVLRTNVLDNLALYASDGRPGGGACTGFVHTRKMVNGREVPTLVHDKPRAKHVRWAAKAALAGMPVSTIATKLDERKVPLPRSGTQWRASSVRRLLRSPTLAGLRVHVTKAKRQELKAAGIHDITLAVAFEHGKVYRGNWVPILDGETFLALQDVLDKPGFVTTSNGRRIPRGTKRGRIGKYLLSGVARCGKCKYNLTGTKRTGKPTLYTCHPANGGCGGIGVLQAEADREVERQFLELLEDHDFRTALAEGDPHAARRTELTATLAEIEENRRADAADLAGNRISRATANTRAEAYDRDEADARAELLALPVPATDVNPDEMLAAWAHSDQQAQRAMLLLVLECAEVLPAQMGGTFHPERIRLVPRRRRL
jgi:Resolvase, N terminal domain/Recombinase/Recombinase zinc beta ribbon domain